VDETTPLRNLSLDEKIRLKWDEKINSTPLPRKFSTDGYRREVGPHTDDEGWQYAMSFARKFGHKNTLVTYVRRRYWSKEK